jgi:Tfp pilus assembly protein PilV
MTEVLVILVIVLIGALAFAAVPTVIPHKVSQTNAAPHRGH